MGRMLNVTPRPLYPRGSDKQPIAQEAGWTSGFVWTGVEYLASIGIRPPDTLARSTLKFFHSQKVELSPNN
jgi:hypothetical protein